MKATLRANICLENMNGIWKLFKHTLLAVGKSYNSSKYYGSKNKKESKILFTFGLEDEQVKNYKFKNSLG